MSKTANLPMNNGDEIFIELWDILGAVDPHEQNELIVRIIQTVQNQRRQSIDNLEHSKKQIEEIFGKLKEDLCNASNLIKL